MRVYILKDGEGFLNGVTLGTSQSHTVMVTPNGDLASIPLR